MEAIDIEKTIRLHLMACNVPESAIKIVHAANADIVTVTVHAAHGTKVCDYSVFQLIHGKPYVVDEMVSIALWYHGPEPIPVAQTWWQSKDLRQRILWLWFAGFTLVVILSIAKHLGWYE